MRYIVTKRGVAETYGFMSIYHLVNSEQILLTEKEVMSASTLNGELEERVETLKGMCLTEGEALNIKEQGGLKYE